MPINMPGKMGSPLEGILTALQAVHAYYGIDTQKAQQKLLATEQAQKDEGLKLSQERGDPNSNASKLAQAEATAAMDAYKKQGIQYPNESALRSMITGTPATTKLEYPGFPGPGVAKEVAAVPGLSAAALDANKEGGPVGKFVGEKMSADSRKAGLDFRDSQLTERQKFRERSDAMKIANKDPELLLAQNRLNGLSRINDIMTKVERGELKGTNQIKNSIANEYAKLEAGTNSSGLGQAERASMVNTLQGDFNDLWTKLSGHINSDGSISSDQMKQLKGETGTMGESYMQQFDQRHQALREGFMYPESQNVLDTKVNSIRSSFATRLGGWKGLGQESSPLGHNNLGQSSGGQGAGGGIKMPTIDEIRAERQRRQSAKNTPDSRTAQNGPF